MLRHLLFLKMYNLSLFNFGGRGPIRLTSLLHCTMRTTTPFFTELGIHTATTLLYMTVVVSPAVLLDQKKISGKDFCYARIVEMSAYFWKEYKKLQEKINLTSGKITTIAIETRLSPQNRCYCWKKSPHRRGDEEKCRWSRFPCLAIWKWAKI